MNDIEKDLIMGTISNLLKTVSLLIDRTDSLSVAFGLITASFELLTEEVEELKRGRKI